MYSFPETDIDACPVKASMFLFEIKRCDESGDVIKLKGLDHVNAYLMHRSVNGGAEDTRPSARALLCYHDFLNDKGLKWNVFGSRNAHKPTYIFRKYLIEMYKQGKFKASTAKAYMQEVVRFYKFYIPRVSFNNPPFVYETVKINIANDHTSITATKEIIVISTDLRLNISEPKSDIPNHLRSLTIEEWDIADEVIRIKRVGLKVKDGTLAEVKIAQEFSMLFLLMRYTGMRREEALTLPANLVFNPKEEQGYSKLHISPDFGMQIKNNKARDVEIPNPLLRILDEYIVSERYQKRRSKFEKINPNSTYIPLFLNRDGLRMNVNTVNTRWGEIRRYIKEFYSIFFNHKPHNLRATYATYRLRELITPPEHLEVKALSVHKALSHIQAHMGHEDLMTTNNYLSQIDGSSDAYQLAEHAIDFQLERV